MLKKSFFSLIIILGVLWSGHPIWASEATQQQNEVIKEQLKLLNWDEVKQMEQQLQAEVPQLEAFDLTKTVLDLVQGEKKLSIGDILKSVGESFKKEITTYIDIVIRFILIVLMCSLLQTMSTSFKSKEVTKTSYFVCYLLIIYTVMHSLWMLVHIAHQTIGQLSDMMMVTMPTLLGFMAVSGYITASSALAPVILGGMNLIVLFLQNMILPIVTSVIVLQIISTMSEEIKVDQLIRLFYKGTKYILRGIFIISIGIMGIYKATLPMIDMTMKKGAMTFSSAFLPVVGDASNHVIEFIMMCSQLIKNSFAIGVILWICLLVSLPLIKILTYILLYYIAGAITQPVGDKKMTQIATYLAKGCEFILSCVGTVAILCIAVMLICISIGTNIA